MTLRSLLGTELSILQAPMAGSQGSALAAAVSATGALGALPCALLGPDAMTAEIERIRAATDRPINVNFFCHIPPEPDPAREAAWRRALAPYYRELGVDPSATPTGPARQPFGHDAADALEPFRPAVVSFHFGLPEPALVARVRSWGTRVLASATTVDEARWLEERGVDAVIAQGLEAGGHRGHFLSPDLTRQLGTLALVPRIAAAVGVPVIAAGGIADARGVAAAVALGAAGVQVGTAFLLCTEATTAAIHRRALQSDTAGHTALTNLFTGRPARSIVNRLMRELGPISPDAPDFPLAAAAILPLRAAGDAAGSGDFSPLWAGQNTSGCREAPAAVLVDDLAAGLPG
jgi:nitronate monooxygenase